MVNTACTATSGTWHSPCNGATRTAASDVDVDIDHTVTLKRVDLRRLGLDGPFRGLARLDRLGAG